MTIIKFITFGLLFFGLNAFADDKHNLEDCPLEKSIALCTLKLLKHDYGGFDSKISEIPTTTVFKDPDSLNYEKIIGTSVAVAGLSKFTTLASNGFGAFLILDSFLDKTNPFDKFQAFVLIPPNIQFGDNLHKFANDTIMDGLEKTFKFTGKTEISPHRFLFKGDFCGEEGCVFIAFLPETKYINIRKLNTPTWLNKEGFVYSRKLFITYRKFSSGDDGEYKEIDRLQYLRLSKNLPDWVYLYFPSNDKKIASVLKNGENVNYTAF